MLTRSPSARPRTRWRTLSHWRRDALSGYVFILPQMIGFLLFVLIPLVYVCWYSLHDWNLMTGQREFVGAANYTAMAGSARFRTVAGNTAVFAFGVLPLNIVGGLGLAVLVDQRLPGMHIFRSLFFLPVVMSLVAWSIIWRFLLQADGGINSLLLLTGLEGPNWLRQPSWAMASVVVVQVLKMVGFSMVLFLAALQGVPGELKEAARIDGARPWTSFRYVTLPLISPTVLMVMLLVTIWSLKAFAQIYLLTSGGPGISTAVIGYEIFSQAFQIFEVGYASAVAVVLLVVAMSLTALQWALRRRWVFHEQ